MQINFFNDTFAFLENVWYNKRSITSASSVVACFADLQRGTLST